MSYVALLLTFLLVELRSRDPLVLLRLFGNSDLMTGHGNHDYPHGSQAADQLRAFPCGHSSSPHSLDD